MSDSVPIVIVNQIETASSDDANFLPHHHHHHHGRRRPAAASGRNEKSRNRTTSFNDVLDEVERFSRRTISLTASSDISAESPPPTISVIEDSDPILNDIEDDDDDHDDIGGQNLNFAKDHPISNFETIIHLLKGNIGIGILTLPVAIKNSGLIAGTIGLGLIAAICVYCMHMLVRSAHKACARRDLGFIDYADTAEASFRDAGWHRGAPIIKKILNIFLCMSQIGSNAVYALFIANNIQPIFEHYGGQIFVGLNYRYYVLMLVIPICLICSIKNLRYLSPFSVFANILQFLGLGIIFYFIFREPLPNSRSLPWLADPSRIPLFFGTAIFAIEGISVVLPIENQMKYPQDMLGLNGVLNTSMILVTCLYVGMGFFGYLKYGESVASSITLNLPSGHILSELTQCLFSLAIFFSYALQFYVVMDIIGNNLLRPRISQRWYTPTEQLTRLLLNLLTLGLAATVPWLDLLVSLLGAVKMSTLSLMAPALIDTATNWRGDLGFAKWKLFKNTLIFIFGLFGCIVGTYTSLLNIIENFRK